jgi:elongation factor 1-alpha
MASLEDELIDLLTLNAEEDDGNVEYKRRLADDSPEAIERKSTQMQYRMRQGDGECFYCIGIDDDGSPYGQTPEEEDMTLEILSKIADMNDYTMTVLDTRKIDDKTLTRVFIRENNVTRYREIRVGIAGHVDVGKSTLVGHLVTGEKDDGRGKTRQYSFNFKHELETGRTSSMSQHIIGYDINGKHIPLHNDLNRLTWQELTKNSAKVVTLFDLCGHLKYANTTYTGMSSNHIDIMVMIISATVGINKSDMTIEHIRMANAYRIPIVFVMTKIDMVIDKPDLLRKSKDSIHNLFGKKAQKKLLEINNITDVMTAIEQGYGGKFIPLFFVSSVTGNGTELLHQYLNMCPPRHTFDSELPVLMEVGDSYSISGIGTVIGGFLSRGTIKISEKYFLGPTKNGDFIQVKVRTMHEKRRNVHEATAGKYICLGTPGIKRNIVRRGMIISNELPQPVKSFTAEIIVSENHHTTVKVGYCPLMIVKGYRSSVKITKLYSEEDIDIRRSKGVAPRGKRIKAEMETVYRPCYILKGDRVVLVDGSLRIVGIVISVN